MISDEFNNTVFSINILGKELIMLYKILLLHEESLSPEQFTVLEHVRAILYANMSIKEIEEISK